jgi:inorganic pyrophosphatase
VPGYLDSPEVYLHNSDHQRVSWWDNVPLQGEDYRSDEFNLVLEISQNDTTKMEVNTEKLYNPIVQDTLKDKKDAQKKILRHYAIDPIFNYGCIPQTWEDPTRKSPFGDYYGDGDPIDVVEISGAPMESNTVHKVRVLGAW